MEASRTPLGRINNGLLIHELLLDNTEELKVYALGFGQVEQRETGARSHLALYNRVNAPFGHVPDALDSIESLAEDVLDAVPNWRRVNARANQIAQRWNTYRPQAIAAGATPEFRASMGALVAQLRAAAQARDATATNEAANDLRTVAVDLMNFYNPRVPADIKRLQVLERELMGDVRRGDWTEAMIFHAKAADAVWGRLRPFVLRRAGGARLAAELDEIFADQAEALEEHQVGDALEAARDAIEAADELECRF